MKSDEQHRSSPGRRMGTDRRRVIDLHYGGPERRGRFERRYGVSRRSAY